MSDRGSGLMPKTPRLDAGAAVTIEAACAADVSAIRALLAQAQLPTADLDGPHGVSFWVARGDGVVLGAVGLETFGSAGLLRSLVVAPQSRGSGLGIALADAAESAARSAGVHELVLLTQTAEPFFARRGYGVIERAAAPAAVRASPEFGSLCPASATCMRKRLA